MLYDKRLKNNYLDEMNQNWEWLKERNFSPIFVFNPLPQLLYMKSMIYIPSKKMSSWPAEACKAIPLDIRTSPLPIKIYFMFWYVKLFSMNPIQISKKWTRYCWYKHTTTIDELKSAPWWPLLSFFVQKVRKTRGLHTHYTRAGARNIWSSGPPLLEPWPTLSVSLNCTF